MATIEWPASLPQAMLRDGFDEGLADNNVRDDFDTGPGGVRPRSTAAPRPVQGAFVMTDAQWETFKTFYDDTLSSGSLAFGFSAFGEEWLVRFTGPPKRSHMGGAWRVAVAWEILP